MSDRPDLEREVGRWLAEEAPGRAPDRLVHSVRGQIGATSQARKPWLLGSPLPLSERRLAIAALAVAAVLIVMVALPLLHLGSSIGGPGPQPSPTPTAVPTLTSLSPYSCPVGGGTCLGPLGAGIYQSNAFAPRVRYALPAGWDNTADVRGQLDLRYGSGGSYRYPDGTTFHDGISIYRRPLAESNVVSEPLAGVGGSALELADWLFAHPDLVASTPTPVNINGVPGYRLEISLSDGLRTQSDHCTTDHGEPACASLFLSVEQDARYGFGLVGPESAVIYLIDAPTGDTVMVVIDDVDGVDPAGLVAAASPVVDSLTFAP